MSRYGDYEKKLAKQQALDLSHWMRLGRPANEVVLCAEIRHHDGTWECPNCFVSNGIEQNRCENLMCGRTRQVVFGGKRLTLNEYFDDELVPMNSKVTHWMYSGFEVEILRGDDDEPWCKVNDKRSESNIGDEEPVCYTHTMQSSSTVFGRVRGWLGW